MYRVFISYSHHDSELASRIAKTLEGNGLRPMWDRNFLYGYGFHDQIKNFIAYAHVFLPVITKAADERKWVHQEIGYAMALNIPMLPLALGTLPGEMLQQIQAVMITEDVESFKGHLSHESIHNMVQRHSSGSLALYQCADFAEDRAATMAKYANDVRELGYRDLVRQKGALSSFHIPDKTINHPVWRDRYGGQDRGPHHCRLQREERIALEAHARVAGCKLIINPAIAYRQYGESARIVRLRCLLDFLESMPDDKCQVAIDLKMAHSESVTIVGDWFSAESVSAQIGRGYRQTIFTRHAPSMVSKTDAFDREFDERLDANGWQAETSRTRAIEEIRRILDEAKQNMPPAQ